MTQISNSLAPATEREMWRLTEVRKCVPLSKPTIYRLIAEGRFPRPVGLTPGTSAWLASEVREWLEERITNGRKPIGGNKLGAA